MRHDDMLEPGDRELVPTRVRTLRPLAEWLDDAEALAPPRLAIPYLVIAGRVTLFSAREKLGKTTLARQAVAAASRGGEFLGRPTLPSIVLWYALDEAIGDTVRGLAASDADPARVFLTDAAPSAAIMAADIVLTGATLVVVDTLSDLLGSSGISENDSDFGGLLKPYVTVSRETGASLLVIHHANKAGREYRGTTRLGAVVDVICNMRSAGRSDEQSDDLDLPTADDDPRRILEVRGRGVRERVKIAFDGSQYTLGDGTASLPDRIGRALLLAGEPMTTNQLIAAVGGRRETVLAELEAQVAAGMVTRRHGPRGSTLYSRSSHADWFPRLVPDVPGGMSGNQSGNQSHRPGTSAREPRGPQGTGRELVGTSDGNQDRATGSRVCDTSAVRSGTSGHVSGSDRPRTERVRVLLTDGTAVETTADDPEMAPLGSMIDHVVPLGALRPEGP